MPGIPENEISEEFWEFPGILTENLLKLQGKPLELAPFQEEIVKEITQPVNRRVIICCSTQAGKSLSTAAGILLSAILHDNERIVIVSHSIKQAKIIYDYVINFLVNNPYFKEFINYEAVDAEKLKKELSREKMTFKNGSSIKILSAGGIGKGEGLLGHSADKLIIDESGSIDDDVYNQKILRMLGAQTEVNKQLIEIGTPHVKNHFFKSWNDPDFKKIRINWKMAVEQKRLDEEFVIKQKEIMSQMEFKMWYEAEFPEESEDSLFRDKWLQDARNSALTLDPEQTSKKYIGLDVAEMGIDLTVACSVIKQNGIWFVQEPQAWGKKDTMVTSGKVKEIADNFIPEKINVDSNGVGAGVKDRLVELGFKCNGFKAGMSPTTEKDKERFANLKAQGYWKLRDLFENGKIVMSKNNKLYGELGLMRYEFTSNRKIRIVDPSKSPDFADALMLAVNSESGFTFGFA